MKVFGREPAAWLGLVAVIVKLVAAFGLDVSADQQAAINGVAAAAMGVLVAAFVHDGLGAAIVGLAQAALRRPAGRRHGRRDCGRRHVGPHAGHRTDPGRRCQACCPQRLTGASP
jgi:hypothetical protein